MAASQDAQIADASRQGLPHCHLEGMDKQAEQGKKDNEQKKRTRFTTEATQTVLTADALATALKAVPDEDWCRTWPGGRTIMLRRTSKRVKEVVDKMRL